MEAQGMFYLYEKRIRTDQSEQRSRKRRKPTYCYVVSRRYHDEHVREFRKMVSLIDFLYNVPRALPLCSVPDYEKSKDVRPISKGKERMILSKLAKMLNTENRSTLDGKVS